jgi:CheY-like chemotaxis protein
LPIFEKPPLTRRVIGLEPGQPVYRLLMVDDQEVNRKLLIKIFQPLGFELRQAADGAEALRGLAGLESAPDLDGHAHA